MSERSSIIAGASPPAENEHWTSRHGKPIIFVIVTLIVAGAYLATGIPVSVFPSTEFPRIVIGVDNGVAPIDQMLVTVTRPIEEAVNSVQGLERVKSVTSRGTAQVDLYFDWGVKHVRDARAGECGPRAGASYAGPRRRA
jgi:multidrug efflux pump subunit AcrB